MWLSVSVAEFLHFKFKQADKILLIVTASCFNGVFGSNLQWEEADVLYRVPKTMLKGEDVYLMNQSMSGEEAKLTQRYWSFNTMNPGLGFLFLGNYLHDSDNPKAHQ